MNILLTSAGRRTKLVEYFKKELKGAGKIITADCSALAPALYTSDKGYIVPPLVESGYMTKILEICSEENISAVLSLIDPEITVLAQNRKAFEDMGVKVIASDFNSVEICNDKLRMHDFIGKQKLSNVKIYADISGFSDAYSHGQVKFPVFVKKRFGSASGGAMKIKSMESLKAVLNEDKDLFIQEFIDGRELGIDAYVDIISKEVVSIFIKKKFHMRAGETDKAVSVIEPAAAKLVEQFIKKLCFEGPLDIDIIERDNSYYIIDINCRFGGGYPLAYECGENYPLYIINNLQGEKNKVRIGVYPEGVRMMKHDDVMIIRP